MSAPTSVERRALQHAFDRLPLDPGRVDEPDSIALTGIIICLQLGSILAGDRLRLAELDITHKPDGTLQTSTDRTVEALARQLISEAFPDHSVHGEEAGASGEAEYQWAVDPVDATWNLLTFGTNFSVTLALRHGGSTLAGFVHNPITGELGYAVGAGRSRLIAVPSALGSGLASLPLPIARPGGAGRYVQLHATPRVDNYWPKLLEARPDNRLHGVASPAGSPAYFMLRAAKGFITYVNPWGNRPAAPYDLAAGVKLIENAGGRVVDGAGRPIEPIGHAGLFIAGCDAATVDLLVELLG